MSDDSSPVRHALISPRLTRDYLISLIKDTYYHHFPGTRVTVCCVRTINGHEFVGDAICAEKRRFDFEKGKSIAFEKVLLDIASAERYLLRQRLFEYRNRNHV